ncbi:MAG: sigma-70 family RNA polymerase sigma factor [Lachnospiraceae bacterium]|nr:sigma-70 family RNA polymerase sigma factor [Lachnospiraceae bacterium]
MSNEEFVTYAEKYMDAIYRIAYSWTKNSDDANDVTQDVLIQLYKTTKEFESDSHMKNWLMKVTVNRCKMIFRSPWSKLEDIENYVETLGFEEETHLDLFLAVMNLDKKYRVPLMLFYYEGYSTTEISSLLDIPEKTVSTRLFRAKGKLRDYLKEE